MKFLILVVVLIGLAMARGAGRPGRAAERRLFLSLNRNQKFYRQEDRQRCGITSPGGNEQDHERTDAAANDEDPAAKD